ncbi:PfkB family carbohydrate kinase [uncultured Methanobrevibacter sp.]|uniref:PfkB family carbohydrate kinase n=1 Tax=uncultured Methanobrevibacter sp. TaxID=253161 RepID=UPI0025F51622|nr:PfkB family carbohydrate kinase [uncultured Methanobrevibacter sp.]
MLNFLIIGPITKDINSFQAKVSISIGGPVYYESFVFENLNLNYTVLTTLKKEDEYLLDEFPDKEKIIKVFKENTLEFENIYLNDSTRTQKSNFANIPITVEDFENSNINVEDYDGILFNPLVFTDLDLDLLRYLSKFNIPILLSLQGSLRYSSLNGSVEYKVPLNLGDILKYIDFLFLDEFEFKFIYPSAEINNISSIFNVFDICEVIITRNHKGSIVYDNNKNIYYDIKPYVVKRILSPTGAGDTYMAAYSAKRLNNGNIEDSGKFASVISSLKIESIGPFNNSLNDVLDIINEDIL